MINRVATNDNELQRMTANDNEQQRVVQWMVTSDNEQQRVTTNGNKWLFRLILLFLQIREGPTTKQPKEKLLNLEKDFEKDLLN